MVSWKVRSSAFVVLVAVSVSICADFLVLNGARAESPAASTSTVAAQSANSKKSPEQLRQEIAELTKKIEAEPKVAKNYGRRGLRYHDLGEYQKALQDFDRALALDPNDGRVYSFKGDTFFAQKRIQEAITQFSKSIEAGPASAETYVRRSICYQLTNELHPSLRDALTAVKIDSADPLSWRHLGLVQLRQRDFKSAHSSLTKAIALDPSNGEAYYFRAQAKLALDLKTEASRDAEKARQLGFVGASGQ